MADFQTVNALYGKRFSGVLPARTTVQAKALPKGGLVEIEMDRLRAAALTQFRSTAYAKRTSNFHHRGTRARRKNSKTSVNSVSQW